MATIRFHQTTTATPEQFIAGLTDFGPGRSKLFKNSADGTSRCTVRAPSRPMSPRARAASGNACTTTGRIRTTSRSRPLTPTSSAARPATPTRLTPQADGTTAIDVVLVREGKNLKGRVVAGVLGTIGKRSLAKAFANSVKAIEARLSQPSAER